MKRRNIYVGISIILIVLVFLIVSNFDITGRLGSVYTTCEDTDGGDEKFVKGIVTYTEYGRENVYTDYCFARTGKGPEKWVKEYYCDVHERIDAHDYNCELYGGGCVDGACIPEKTAKCTDSDDGLNYKVKGETCVGSDCKTDLCLNLTSPNNVYVSEGYCKNETTRDNKIYKCEYKCENGICVKAEVEASKEVVEEIEEEVPKERESFGKILAKLFCKISHPKDYEAYEECIA